MLWTWCSFQGGCVKYVLLNFIFFTKLFSVFPFSCLLICFYSSAFEESGLALEQEAGGYGTIKEITG